MKNMFIAGIVIGMLSYYALSESESGAKQLLKKVSKKMEL